jgi:hypothetical protein
MTVANTNAQFDRWKDAIAEADTFKYAKVSGDRDLIRRVWTYLRDKRADPLSRDMLALKDLELGINSLIEKAQKLDALEVILNDVGQSDKQTIERMAEVFYG